MFLSIYFNCYWVYFPGKNESHSSANVVQRKMARLKTSDQHRHNERHVSLMDNPSRSASSRAITAISSFPKRPTQHVAVNGPSRALRIPNYTQGNSKPLRNCRTNNYLHNSRKRSSGVGVVQSRFRYIVKP